MNNAGNPLGRQGHDWDDLLRDQEVARKAVGRWILRLERAVAKLSQGSNSSEAAEGMEARALALLAMPPPPRGAMEVRVTLWKPEGPTEEVLELDPALGARVQAQNWLAKSKKLRRTVDRQAQRLTELEEELREAGGWQSELAGWNGPPVEERGERKRRLARLAALRVRLLPRGLWPQPPRPAGEKRQDGPLRFTLPGGWTLLAGRSGTENDLLTGRIAKADDLWFHAAHVPGSHVILKSPDGKPVPPPQPILEQAAGLAAWLSKLRAQERAQVLYTHKRHVRKPRKAPAGTVVLEHSLTLLVKPMPPPRETLPG